MAINIQRLDRLALLLDKSASGAEGPGFDLGDWSTRRYRNEGHLWWKRRTECGTTACAVGLACMSGTFKADGLGMWIDEDGLEPTFHDKTGWDAVAAFFGLSFDQASRLFSQSSYEVYVGPQAAAAVAARIRAMIKRSRTHSRKRDRTLATVELIKARALEPA